MTGEPKAFEDTPFNRAWHAVGKHFDDIAKRISFQYRVLHLMPMITRIGSTPSTWSTERRITSPAGSRRLGTLQLEDHAKGAASGVRSRVSAATGVDCRHRAGRRRRDPSLTHVR